MYRFFIPAVLCFALADFKSIPNAKIPQVLRSSKLDLKDVPIPRPLKKSVGQGGLNGSAFDDEELFRAASITGIHSINITSGDQVNSIEVVYILANKTLLTAPRHGNKPSDNSVNITFSPDEQIIKIEGKTNGELVDQLTITTIGPNYEERIYGPFGRTGTLSFQFEGQAIAFFGRSGDMMDNIGVHYLDSLKKSEQIGGTEDDDFDDYYALSYPPITGIRGINIWSTQIMLIAFQVEYVLLDGSLLLGPKHGREANTNLTTIIFQDEVLIALEGKRGLLGDQDRITELTFITLKESGDPGKYGPFGGLGETEFDIPGNIVSFFGNSGDNINSIGVFYV